MILPKSDNQGEVTITKAVKDVTNIWIDGNPELVVVFVNGVSEN